MFRMFIIRPALGELVATAMKYGDLDQDDLVVIGRWWGTENEYF
jgi:hypothetical protein